MLQRLSISWNIFLITVWENSIDDSSSKARRWVLWKIKQNNLVARLWLPDLAIRGPFDGYEHRTLQEMKESG